MAERYRELIPDGIRRKIMTKVLDQVLEIFEKLGPADAELAILSGVLSVEEILARRGRR